MSADDYDETPLNPALQMAQHRSMAEVEAAFPPPVDHRALLVRYMRHVSRSVSHLYENRETFTEARPPREFFSDAEWAELRRLAEEARR
jgi:hypothetical protein